MIGECVPHLALTPIAHRRVDAGWIISYHIIHSFLSFDHSSENDNKEANLSAQEFISSLFGQIFLHFNISFSILLHLIIAYLICHIEQSIQVWKRNYVENRERIFENGVEYSGWFSVILLGKLYYLTLSLNWITLLSFLSHSRWHKLPIADEILG